MPFSLQCFEARSPSDEYVVLTINATLTGRQLHGLRNVCSRVERERTLQIRIIALTAQHQQSHDVIIVSTASIADVVHMAPVLPRLCVLQCQNRQPVPKQALHVSSTHLVEPRVLHRASSTELHLEPPAVQEVLSSNVVVKFLLTQTHAHAQPGTKRETLARDNTLQWLWVLCPKCPSSQHCMTSTVGSRPIE